MKYLTYTAKDFVKDSFFQKWVLDPDEETDAYWRTWLVAYPHKRTAVEEAKKIIAALDFQPDLDSNKAFIEVWEKINAERRRADSNIDPEGGQSFSLWLKQHQQLAAVLIGVLLLSCSLFFLLRTPETPAIHYATQYGQTDTIVLPDSSVVTLNANSSISYADNWNDDEPREVWLKGEAFFKVLKKGTARNSKFKVHADGLSVEVLGTQFNVKSRRKNTKVVLSSGKVKLNLHKNRQEKSIVMQPGDYVEYSEEDTRLKRRRVDTEFYSSWVENKLMFNKTTLQEIAALVKDNYGVQLNFQDAALAHKRFTGMVPADDVNLLLKTLEKLYDLDMIKVSENIILMSSAQSDSVGA